MSKTLITRQNYRDFLDPDEKSVTICNQMILTPGAKDFLREHQIRMIYEDQKKESPEIKQVEKEEGCLLADRIYLLLKKEFNTDDKKLAEKIAGLITNK